MRLRSAPTPFFIWLFAGIIALLACSIYFSAAHFKGEYLPLGNDSFYHARRILDAVRNHGVLYQFDPRIHAPEGSLLVWPWGYDYLIAQLVRLGVYCGLSSDPMAILIWIPTISVLGSIALLVHLSGLLRLSSWPMTLAALCMALSPTTQFLHGVGQIDHHYAEMMLVIAALACGLKWLNEQDSTTAAITLGLVFGCAPAIHNGLFVLQIPFLVTLAIRWLQGISMPQRPTAAFAVALLVATTAISVPSVSFREGNFEFYTLSWFHLYVAFCTAFAATFLALRPCTKRNACIFAVAALLLTLPILGQIRMAQSFVAGSFKWLETIAEMKSPLKEAFTPEGAKIISNIYTYLVWVAPLTFALCVWQGWRDRKLPRLLFWIASIAGLTLLAAQVRLHYFGDFALYMPWLIMAQDYVNGRPALTRPVFLAASLALIVLYVPALRHQLIAPVSTANDRTFEDTRPMFSALQKACHEDPGIVLADNNAGHYIRYYTDCSVIINNFLLTPQHFAKMDEAERLFSTPANEIVHVAPMVKYVLIRPLDIRRSDSPTGGYHYWFFFPGKPQLATDLLLSPLEKVPPQYELLYEIRFPQADNIPYARLYKIQR